jgi:hypothetical protein
MTAMAAAGIPAFLARNTKPDAISLRARTGIQRHAQ